MISKKHLCKRFVSKALFEPPDSKGKRWLITHENYNNILRSSVLDYERVMAFVILEEMRGFLLSGILGVKGGILS